MAQGTIAPFPGFNPEADSKRLRDAMKGVGTDEKTIIDILCYRSNAQRQEIKLKYKSMYGRELADDLKSELSGHFEDIMVGLLLPPADYDATSIKKAVKGLGTDEAALIEVICTSTNEELAVIKEAYKKLFGKEMEKAVASDLSGDFKRLMVACITATRDPDGPVDTAKATQDAKHLYDAGEKRWGTDEAVFTEILAGRSYSHLRAVFDEYPKFSKHEIETAIKKEMSGDLENAMLAIVKSVRSRPAFFAERLYKSMKGLGTDDDTLVRVMVSRAEKDMVQIKQAFKDKYGKTLYDFIKDDTSGDYERALLAICRD